ncbi:MAG: cell division control protein Cdc6, partial [Candidatus Nanohaloarchaea archaeon]
LKKILQKRSPEAFQEGALEEGVISKAAAHIAQNDGDAREALRTIRKAGNLASTEGKETVSTEDVERARELLEANK